MYVFDRAVGRRAFIRGGGATVAGAVAGVGLTGCAGDATEHALPVDEEGRAVWGRESGEWIPSCCNMCGGQCGIMVHVVDGTVTKIEPNNWNPNNYTNISTDFFDGYSETYGVAEGSVICPKGNAGIAQLYDPDRVSKPLKRTNPDKSLDADPAWEEISWDQALDEIAGRLRALRDAGEAHKLLWISEDHSFVHIQQDFTELYGTPNYSNHSNLCDVARKASCKSVMGDERPLADTIQSRYVMLFGWNPTSAIKWVHLPRIITRAVENGARLVVVDPYLSDTAAKAHEWVSLRPGTDGALALAMAHVIIRDELYDREFIENWTVGFDEFRAHVADKTPEWAEEITSVRAATIERLATELATTKPALVDFWSGPGQHSNGVQGGRAIAHLNTLIGSWDRPGGMIIPSRKGNKHVHIDPDPAVEATLEQPRFDQLDTYPLGHKSGVYARMFENLLEGKGPYDAKAMVCIFQNPVMAVPGADRVAEALAKLELFVVVDTMLSETAMLADYVLPGSTYLERYDLNTHWVTWTAIGLRQPVLKPIFGQPTEYEIVTELGRRLDLRDADGKPFFRIGPVSGTEIDDTTAWYEEYLSAELQAGPGITLEELKAMPGAVYVSTKGTEYAKYDTVLAPDKLATAYFDGDPTAEGTAIWDKPKDEGGTLIGHIIGGQPRRGFFTESGKVEFVSTSLAGKKDAAGNEVDPLPVYTPRDWQPDRQYPLYLINWKEASHTHSRTQNNAILLELKADNPLVVHPDTAERFGVRDGEQAWVTSPYGRVQARVQVSRRIHPEVVGLQHGFGHRALGRLARGRGTADGVLRPVKADPLSGMALHKEACVTISPVR
ncbi:molybdopterin-containing oxidoreductase family protein [Rhabdothermincola sediminis]|uniref:molybdopterin-containing oxidoreductase family protein n=1 Tax=Rhabdothermincola sediminis TaxID=2751370 RepID=UPI001AA05C6A|nr:molybdopterin-dependent oxidoreductase [Rhabdothermincola sediminis]